MSDAPRGFLQRLSMGGMLRALLLATVWGFGIFLWGSLEAWSRHSAIEGARATLKKEQAQVQQWMDTLWQPVEKLATDARLESAVRLPDSVDSVPVMRVLYEFSYLYRSPDVYLVDLAGDKVGQTAGSMALRPEVLARAKEMREGAKFIIGSGERNAVLYFVHRVAAPLPQLLFVLVPVTLHKATPTRPLGIREEDGASGIVIPHTGGWAWWESGSMVLDTGIAQQPAGRTAPFAGDGGGTLVLEPLGNMELGWAALKKPRLASEAALVPKILLALWVLAMTAMILWEPAAPGRAALARRMTPLADRVGGAGRGFVLSLGPLARIGKALSERASREMGAPLVNAPGDFLPVDFSRAKAPDGEAAPRTGKPVSGLKSHVDKGMQESEKLVQANEDMQRQQAERDLKDVVKRCLREGRMTLLYQPIYRAGDYKPVMHEVYARLIHPNGEVMMPGQFLPVCNKFGLTQALDAAVFKKVLETHFGPGKGGATIFGLNVGGTSLDGIAYLHELVSHGSHVIKHFVFEVRSQEIVRDPKALKLLKDIQKHGGFLAVDYFGGGKVMLEASKAMGFDYVKLDASRFGSDEGRAELEGMCATARELGLPVILEKIETRADEDFARGAGVDFLQGYGLAAPSLELASGPLVRDSGDAATQAASAPTAPPAPTVATTS